MAVGEASVKDQVRSQGFEGSQLLNFRDVIKAYSGSCLGKPHNRNITWRGVLETTEDWVKNQQDWPANREKKRKEEEQQRNRQGDEQENDKQHGRNKGEEIENAQKTQGSHQMDQDGQDDEHNQASTINGVRQPGDDKAGSSSPEDERLEETSSSEELSLLRVLEHEKTYISSLEQNDGRHAAPAGLQNQTLSIDEVDQFTPDNWIPRSAGLIRLTGKHPLNAQPDLTVLFDAGFITPNDLFYVRNHGAVPPLRWRTHHLDIQSGKLTLSMDEIKKFDSVNLPIMMACSSNRRKELNMLKKTKGYHWGAGAVGCALWRGPFLRDILLASGVLEELPRADNKEFRRYWVHFEGADTPNDEHYATSIPLDYVVDPTNDLILAYEMNDAPLPPDHGYPLRLVVPGYIGGRSVKWLRKIWIDDKENDSYWHHHDNRTLPPFVTDMDSKIATLMIHHPDTACYEQILNSVITKPAQGEEVPVTRGRSLYRIEGFAYDGAGREVQRVEVSLDDGRTWLYCCRRFPDCPIRHGNKFWTWVFWYIDVEILNLIRATSIIVRCFNACKNAQPQEPSWNIIGTMNNCWYRVTIESSCDDKTQKPCLLFRHPVEPGSDDQGWMQPSQENQIQAMKREASAPEKQFAKEEIEQHGNEQDCWIVMDNRVYDATSVLSWHPGGPAAVLAHAGKVHHETTAEYSSIHDDYAYAKLQECILGVVDDKAKRCIEQTREAAVKKKAAASHRNEEVVLQQDRWMPCRLKTREAVSHDTNVYTFELPNGYRKLGMGTCQHIQVGYHFRDRMAIRPYTPTSPLLPAKGDEMGAYDDLLGKGANALREGTGTFDLTVKTYFPSESQPGGAFSNILDCMSIGQEIDIRGPFGDVIYHGHGNFSIEGVERRFGRVSLILGGTGLTPGFSLIARVLLTHDDETELRVIDANISEDDILLRRELDEFEKRYPQQFKIMHVLSEPQGEWKGRRGFVKEDMIKEQLFEPGDGNVLFLCGPPAMIEKAVLPVVKEWGYKEHEDCFQF